MSLWDYFPHPFEHPAWFFSTITIVSGMIAGLCGDSEMMCAIFASGLGLYYFVRIANWFYHGVDKAGLTGRMMRCWLGASIVWSAVFGMLYAENPKPLPSTDFGLMLLPWVVSAWYLRYQRPDH